MFINNVVNSRWLDQLLLDLKMNSSFIFFHANYKSLAGFYSRIPLIRPFLKVDKKVRSLGFFENFQENAPKI